MILDGRKLAGEILARTKVRASKLTHVPNVVALSASDAPATRSYLGIKNRYAKDAGCNFEVRPYPSDFSDADAVIIQLPLPGGVDSKATLDTLPVEKDADVLSSAARAKFEGRGPGALLPPVVAAIAEILQKNNVKVKAMKAVVIGSGWLVGAPAASYLKQQGALVTTLNSKTEDITSALLAADIIVSGAGSSHLIKPGMLKQGVVLIDAGTSESGGALAGDADPACAAKCALFTPVPGGVGPVAVAKLFENVVTLAERNIDKSRDKT